MNHQANHYPQRYTIFEVQFNTVSLFHFLQIQQSSLPSNKEKTKSDYSRLQYKFTILSEIFDIRKQIDGLMEVCTKPANLPKWPRKQVQDKIHLNTFHISILLTTGIAVEMHHW